MISEFSKMGFLGKDLEALKVVANHKCAVHLSDIVCCDGQTINRWMLTAERGDLEGHRFPHKNTTRSDFRLWNDVLPANTDGTLCLESTLGNFVQEPHVRYNWTLNCETSQIYQHRD